MEIIIERDSSFANATKKTEHFITTKLQGYSKGNYGACNLGFWCGEDSHITIKNKELLSRKLEISSSNIIVPREIHKNNVAVIDQHFKQSCEIQQQELLMTADAVITSLPNTAVAVSTADCVPIICTDNETFVAAIHAGWRGIVSNIITNTIDKLENLGCDINKLTFLVGPCISGLNYEIGEDVWHEFENSFNDNELKAILIKKTTEKFFPDIRTAVDIQISRKTKKDNIFHFNANTYTDTRFYSVRKEGAYTGRFLTGIMLKA